MDTNAPDSAMEQAPAPPPAPRLPWRQSRYAFAVVHFLLLLFVWFALRFVLLLKFSPLSTLTPLDAWHIFRAGVHRDAFAGLALTIPLLFWFWLIPNRWFRARWHQILFRGAYFFFLFVLIFLLFVEYYFFDEFK